MAYINIDNIDLYYEKTGDGKTPVVLLHGWEQNTKMMQPIIEMFEHKEKYTFYNVDFPGHGNTRWPKQSWGVPEYTTLIDNFLKELKIKKPILVSHSFGGRVSILHASRSQNVSGLILIDAAGVRTKASFIARFKSKSFKSLKVLLNFVPKQRKDELYKNLNYVFGSRDYINMPDDKKAIFIKVVNLNLTNRLEKIKVPVQLIWGEDDSATPLKHAQIMKEKIPNAHLVAFENAGHFAYLDNPNGTKIAINNYLEREFK